LWPTREQSHGHLQDAENNENQASFSTHRKVNRRTGERHADHKVEKNQSAEGTARVAT
jgi:hypothetical protein